MRPLAEEFHIAVDDISRSLLSLRSAILAISLSLTHSSYLSLILRFRRGLFSLRTAAAAAAPSRLAWRYLILTSQRQQQQQQQQQQQREALNSLGTSVRGNG
jgi:hypothetical protein